MILFKNRIFITLEVIDEKYMYILLIDIFIINDGKF